MATNRNQIYNSLLTGKTVKLTDQIGKGGAGSIHKVYRKRSVVAKVLFRPTKDTEIRIKEMVKDFQKGKINLDLNWRNNIKTKLGTWPIDLLYDNQKKFKGFLMPKASGIELQLISSNNFNKYPKYKNFSKLRNKLILCQRLAVVFSNFYKSGNYSNGDIKPQNIYVDDKGFPMILDLDNLTINNKTPKDKQGTPGYMAHDYSDDIYTDYFSIAIIFYELIFGLHPYIGSAKNDKIVETQDKIKNRMFVHGRKKRNFHVIPPPHEAFKQVINKEIQILFHQAFDLDDPKKRPNMEKWAKTLQNFILSKNIFKDTYKPNQKAAPSSRRKTTIKGTTRKKTKRGTLFGNRPNTTRQTATYATPQSQPALHKKYVRHYVISIVIMVFCIIYGSADSGDVFSVTVGSFGIWCLYYYLYWKKKVVKAFGPQWKQYFNLGAIFKTKKTKANNLKKSVLDYLASFAVLILSIWVFNDSNSVENDLLYDFIDDDILEIYVPILMIINIVYFWPVRYLYKVSNKFFSKILIAIRFLSSIILLLLYLIAAFNLLVKENNYNDFVDQYVSTVEEAYDKIIDPNQEITTQKYKTSFDAFMDFKKSHKVVHKDLIYKGGLIDYKKGWNSTDSLIIIEKSENIKKHYFIKKGTSYETRDGISFNSTQGYGWTSAKRKIYLDIDEYGMEQIRDKGGWQTWQVRRLGLGDEIIVSGSDIKFNKEDNDFGVYFIENNIESFKRYISNNSFEEEFISESSLNKIFKNPPLYNNKNIHVVKKGETCYRIAKIYGLKLEELYRMNPKARQRISPGMKLLIFDESIANLKNSSEKNKKFEKKNRSNNTLEENFNSSGNYPTLEEVLEEPKKNEDENKISNNLAKHFTISSIKGYDNKNSSENKRRKITFFGVCISPKDFSKTPSKNCKFYVRIIGPDGNLLKINTDNARNRMTNKNYWIFENSSNFGRNGIEISGLSKNIQLPTKFDICISYYLKNNDKMGIKIDEKINLVPGEYTVGVYIKDEDQYFAEFVGEDYFMVE